MSWLGDTANLSPAGELFALLLGSVVLLRLARFILRVFGLGS